MGRPRKDAQPQFIAALTYYLNLRGWKVEDLAKYLGMSRTSLYNRIKRPETFCFGELLQISKLFKVTLEFTADGVTMKGEGLE